MRANEVTVGTPLGERIKTYRTKRKLSLSVLAETSGISKSLISQIERSVVNPSVATIRSLVRRDERRRLFLPGSTVERQLLTPEHRQTFVLLTMNIQPEELSSVDLTQHGGEECVYVRTGCLSVRLGDQVIELQEGDSLYFNALVPHGFVNGGKGVAEVISCIAPGIAE